MISRNKQLIEYLFPPVLLDAVRAARAHLRNPRILPTLRPNRRWWNAFAGEKVYVLGNGPSLGAVDRSLLRGRRAIVMNSFCRADWKHDVEIVAHCLGEPRMSLGWGSHMVASINGTDSASCWLHFSSNGHLTGIKEGKQLHYVFPSVEAGLWPSTRKIRLHSSTMGYVTTAQLAIQVALYMGFSKIVLLGFDHDWLASPGYSRHFYSDQKDPEDKLDHYSYLDMIEFSRRMWNIYYKLREVARSHHADIYNLSGHSYLDVFERIEPPVQAT